MQGGDTASTTCCEGFATVAPDLRTPRRSRLAIGSGSKNIFVVLFSDGNDGERLDGGCHGVSAAVLSGIQRETRFVRPHGNAEPVVGGDIRAGRSEARRDAFGKPR